MLSLSGSKTDGGHQAYKNLTDPSYTVALAARVVGYLRPPPFPFYRAGVTAGRL